MKLCIVELDSKAYTYLMKDVIAVNIKLYYM